MPEIMVYSWCTRMVSRYCDDRFSHDGRAIRTNLNKVVYEAHRVHTQGAHLGKLDPVSWFHSGASQRRRRILPNSLRYCTVDRIFRETSIGAEYLADKEHLYLGDALGNDVIRERRELLLQLMEQLHDSDVRAMALPHRGPPSSWQAYLWVPGSLVTPSFDRI